jgi:hypothetical protein
MDKGLEHEQMRFRTMTKNQLYTRLSRITKLDKLNMFEYVAGRSGYADLVDAAKRRRMAILKVEPRVTPPVERAKPINRPSQPSPVKQAIKEPSPLRRSLDF